MLLATKLLLKNLWIEWNKGGLAKGVVEPIRFLPTQSSDVVKPILKPNKRVPRRAKQGK
jgi:hypothetical protein